MGLETRGQKVLDIQEFKIQRLIDGRKRFKWERFGSIGKPDILSDSKTHGSAKTLMGPNSLVLLQLLQSAGSLSCISFIQTLPIDLFVHVYLCVQIKHTHNKKGSEFCPKLRVWLLMLLLQQFESQTQHPKKPKIKSSCSLRGNVPTSCLFFIFNLCCCSLLRQCRSTIRSKATAYADKYDVEHHHRTQFTAQNKRWESLLQFGGWDWISSNANLKTAKETLKLARLVKDACRRISALTC